MRTVTEVRCISNVLTAFFYDVLKADVKKEGDYYAYYYNQELVRIAWGIEDNSFRVLLGIPLGIADITEMRRTKLAEAERWFPDEPLGMAYKRALIDVSKKYSDLLEKLEQEIVECTLQKSS
ncbi:MAG: hypothetical protein H0U76_22160 [Ktedonobacteraceae bacterium]|nr:hypothetical protein [Ktedonobacteraceae bacterium]